MTPRARFDVPDGFAIVVLCVITSVIAGVVIGFAIGWTGWRPW